MARTVAERPTSDSGGRTLRRVAGLAVTGVSLYLVAPAVLEVASSWHRLGDVWPVAITLIVVLETGSLACVWLLQYQMLKRAGIETGAAISALTAANLLTFATLLALPLLALPALLLGTSVSKDLTQGLWVALVSLVVLLAVGAVLLATARPLRGLGSAIQATRNRLYRRREPLAALPERLVAERDLIMRALGRSWWEALGGAIGRWLLDFAALLVAVEAVGDPSSPSLVLLAFVTAQVLAQVPVTPGGLGFVEAGLTATLVLAGVGAEDAVLATLAYRLASYWLPLPAGAVAWGLHMRRYRGGPEIVKRAGRCWPSVGPTRSGRSVSLRFA